jgi:hypothetical protein
LIVRNIGKGRSGPRERSRPRALAALIGAGALASIGAVAATAATAAPAGTHPGPRAIAPGKPLSITKVGTVNFSALARAAARTHAARALSAPHAIPQRLPSFVKAAGSHVSRTAIARVPRVVRSTGFSGNVTGEKGFNGLDHTANENVFGFDISPPDGAVGVGTGPNGSTIVIESLNLVLQAFTPSGTPLTAPIGANAFMGIGPCTGGTFPVNCPSDPRVLWDPQTKHWFITDFTFSSSPLGLQFIAVSKTTNGLGSYTVFALPTGAGFVNPSDCPCVGDFDMIGTDHNGFYLTENEFGQTSYHGAVLFAFSKGGLIAAANGIGLAIGFVYTVPTLSDPFGGFRLAPASPTPGSTVPNDEYFVEADANLVSDTSLETWALLDTNTLNATVPSAPPLVETGVSTEGYSIPPPGTQKAGPIPFGNSVGALVAQPLDGGFDIEQGTTFANGNLYVQMATGVNAGGAATRDGIAWIVLHPSPGDTSVAVTNKGQGYVSANAELLYPTISVNANGDGWMGFTVAGANHFPSAAYIRFDDDEGAVGSIHIAKSGTTPLDDFTCYPTIGFGPTCRFGDYSASQFFKGRIYIETEYIHALTDVLGGADTNWASRVFSVPVNTSRG